MIVKQGDTHAISWKANLDLTGASVRVVARPRNGDPIILASTLLDAAAGVVQHMLTGTLALGSYKVELEVTDGAEIITFPNNSYASLTVIPDLD